MTRSLFAEFQDAEDAKRLRPCSQCGSAVRWAKSQRCCGCYPRDRELVRLLLVDWPHRPHWVSYESERRAYEGVA